MCGAKNFWKNVIFIFGTQTSSYKSLNLLHSISHRT